MIILIDEQDLFDFKFAYGNNVKIRKYFIHFYEICNTSIL